MDFDSLSATHIPCIASVTVGFDTISSAFFILASACL